MDKYQELINKLGFNRVKLDEPLSSYTNMKVGGPAEFLYQASNKKDLAEAIILARELNLPYIIIGTGANVLISDKGVKGLTIVNRALSYKFLANGFLETDSGVNVTTLIKETTDRGFTGLERMIRVPATVGGAVYMNAGHTAKNEFFGDLVVSVEVLDVRNEIRKIPHQDCGFSYRVSRFQKTGEVILTALLHLEKVERIVIEEKVKEVILHKKNQPSGPSMGSTFKNPSGDHAGRLIDQAGLKGKQIGGAKVSEIHANFIINTGNATASDIKLLINQIRETVKNKFGVELEEEIKYLGEW